MAECPVCYMVELDTVTTPQGVRVDDCPQCGGRWFDAGELDAVSKDPEKLRAAILADSDQHPTARVCARCRGTMTNRSLLNRFLRVDYCQACHGFWVDKNELHLVDQLLGP